MISTYQLGGDGRCDINDPVVVSALLHLDGTNGSTTITDSSVIPKAWATTTSSLSTTTPQFGTACLAPGASGYISAGSNTIFGFGSGDFTIEGWCKTSGGGIDRTFFDGRAGGAHCGIYVDTTGEVNQLSYANNAAVIAHAGTTSGSVWRHIAVARERGTVRGFIDGTLVWTVTDARTFANETAPRFGINFVGTQPINTSPLDELRITKGLARYTAGFTPSGPFPNP